MQLPEYDILRDVRTVVNADLATTFRARQSDFMTVRMLLLDTAV
jgi:hypothetical protein